MLRSLLFATTFVLAATGSAHADPAPANGPAIGTFQVRSPWSKPFRVALGDKFVSPQAYLDAKCPGAKLAKERITHSGYPAILHFAEIDYIVPDNGCPVVEAPAAKSIEIRSDL